MTDVVRSGLEKAANQYREYLTEVEGSTLRFYPSKSKTDLSRSYFSVYVDNNAKYRVRRQGKGESRYYEGPDVYDMTEQWVVSEATRFIETTLRDFRFK
jgi:hypothetical protein